MIANGIVALLAMTTSFQDTASYSDPVLGLAFDHPKAWVVGKKTKDSSRYTVPIPDSTETAELEVVRTPFHSSKEIWNTIQVRVNEQLKREVVRQYEQDVLSVPMLFTQVNFTEQGVSKTTLSGLYYTRTPIKLLIRLTAPTAEFEKAQFSFQEALQSLRTMDGSTPTEDDENVPLTVTKNTPKAPPQVKVIKTGGKDKTGPVKLVDVPIVVSTKPVVFRVPEGWRTENVEGGKLTLRHDDLSGPITVEFHSTLDSEPAQNALFKLSSASLNDFTAINRREDTNNEANKAGCLITTVLRIGKSSAGDLAVHESAGVQGNFYFLTSYRQTNVAVLPAERKLIEALLAQVSLQTSE